MPRGLALEILGRRHVCRHGRDGAKPGRSFERKAKRHETATGTADREYAPRVDADFADKLIDHLRQETNVVDVEPVRANVTDNGVVVQMESATQQNAALVEQAATASNALAVQTNQLQTVVDEFKLD